MLTGNPCACCVNTGTRLCCGCTATLVSLRWLRNAGLKMVDQMPEAKALFVRQALGLSGDLPELARP